MSSDKKTRATYTTEELDKIAIKLKELPAIEKSKQKHSKQDAINYLKKEIIELQKRGYSMVNISDTLKGVGIDISTPTLKNYLTRSNIKTGKQTKNKKTQSQDTPPAPPLVSETSEDNSSGKGTFTVDEDTANI